MTNSTLPAAASSLAKSGSIYVHQGSYAVSADPNDVLTTVLGSCVATCLFDHQAGVGGMNHFLLPETSGDDVGTRLYGVNLMELLINDLLRRGADRSRLQAKLFGGGNIIKSASGIGLQNMNFARKFLADEGVPCLAESLGGPCGRRIRFWPVGGRARQILLSPIETEERDRQAVQPKLPSIGDGDVELF